MTCKELAEVLYDFIQGELEEERCRLLKEHLAECSHCVVYIETYQVTVRLGRSLPANPLPEELAQKLQSLMHEDERNA